MAIENLKVPDITCDHCEITLKGALSPIEGIHEVSVDIREKRVQVEYDPGQVDLGRIRGIIESEGYTVAKEKIAEKEDEQVKKEVFRDPVCGMEVEPWNTRFQSVRDGRSYHFCSSSCKQAFNLFPARFSAGAETGKASSYSCCSPAQQECHKADKGKAAMPDRRLFGNFISLLPLPSLLLTVAVVLAACDDASTSPAGKDTGKSTAAYRATLVTDPGSIFAGTPTELRFTVRDSAGAVVRDLPLTHEKPMHLIVVSEDLGEFRHLHPDTHADGSYRLNHSLPHAGRRSRFPLSPREAVSRPP